MVEKHSCRNAQNPTLSEGPPHLHFASRRTCLVTETVSLPVSLGTTARPHSVSVSLSSERVTEPQGRDMDRYREGEAVAVLPSSVSVFVQGEGIDRHSGYL